MTSSTISSLNISAMTVGEIISRSWRLYRLNFKEVFLYTLIPSVVFVVAQIFFNVPYLISANPTTQPDPGMILGLCCAIYPIGFLLLFAGLFVAIFFNACMIKAFYNIITGIESNNKEIIEYIKNNIVSFLKLAGLIILEVLIFSAIDTVLFIVAYFIMLIPMFISAMLAAIHPAFGIIGLVVSILIFFITFMLLAVVFMLQFFFCSMQIVIVVIEKIPVFKSITKSIDIISKDLSRSSAFAFTLFLLWYVLLFFFNLPSTILVVFIMFKEGFASSPHPPFTVIMVATVWNYVAAMLIWPFIISAITLFYYDMRVRLEGLDLRMAIKGERKEIQLY
jgi:hypothetical protein